MSAMSEDDGGPAINPAPRSLWRWLLANGTPNEDEEGKHRRALTVLHQPSHHLSGLIDSTGEFHQSSYFSWSYKSLASCAENLAALWAHEGIQAGDHVLTFVDNSAEWSIFFWTCMRIGAVFVPLDPALIRRREELQWLRESLKPAAVLTQDHKSAEQYQSCCGNAGSEKFKVFGNHLDQSEDTLPGWRALQKVNARKELPPAPHFEGDPYSTTSLIMFTSGTTHRPKGCPVSVAGMAAQIDQYHQFYGSQWSKNVRFLINTNNFRPICYLGAMNTWKAGGSVIFPSKTFAPEASIKAINLLHCTHTWAVPAQLRMLCSFVESQHNGDSIPEIQAPSTLKCVLTSGDVADEVTIAKGKAALRPDSLIASWGMSECAPLFGCSTDKPVPISNRGLRSVGWALPGTSVRIVDPEKQCVLPRGKHGALHVSSPQALIHHYVGNASAEDFYNDQNSGQRWFITGDTAYMDDSGATFIAGRTKDIIKCKAFGIVPSIVEDYLDQTFEVEVCCTHARFLNNREGNSAEGISVTSRRTTSREVWSRTGRRGQKVAQGHRCCRGEAIDEGQGEILPWRGVYCT